MASLCHHSFLQNKIISKREKENALRTPTPDNEIIPRVCKRITIQAVKMQIYNGSAKFNHF